MVKSNLCGSQDKVSVRCSLQEWGSYLVMGLGLLEQTVALEAM